MSNRDTIEEMTIEERTEVYIKRRLAELRGEILPRYGNLEEEHPYIKRRLREIMKEDAERKKKK